MNLGRPPPPQMPPPPQQMPIAVNFGHPATDVIRVQVISGITNTQIDMPHDMAAQVFQKGLQEIARVRSSVLVVPAGALPSKPINGSGGAG